MFMYTMTLAGRKYLKKITLTSSMGPGLNVDVVSAGKLTEKV